MNEIREALLAAYAVPGPTIVEPRNLIAPGVWDSDWPSVTFASREAWLLIYGYVKDEDEFAALWPEQMPSNEQQASGGEDA